MDRLAKRRAATVGHEPAGFSLVELMVALTLSLVVLGGVIAIFASSRKTYETTEGLSRIQDNGRFALESLVRDLRSAGYPGCSHRASLVNTLNTPTDLLWNFSVPVEGFDANGAAEWQPTLDKGVATLAEPGSDALVVRMPRGDVEPVRVAEGAFMAGTTEHVVLEDAKAPIRAGDIVQISDCIGRAVFQVTTNDGGTISHAVVAAAGNLPGNATDDFGYAFTDRAEVIPLQSVVYYLRKASSPDAGTSLWRRVSGSGEAEEVAQGIENMQLLFGESDGAQLQYRRADEVSDWQQVMTVRIALLVRSLSAYGADTDQRDYDVLDETVSAPGDRHLREVFATTVAVRNTNL